MREWKKEERGKKGLSRKGFYQGYSKEIRNFIKCDKNTFIIKY